MSDQKTATSWSENEKIIFRFFFLYFLLQALPLDWKYYGELFAINWSKLHYGDIFNITKYTPKFFKEEESFTNWGFIALLSFLGLTIWTIVDKNNRNRKKENYDRLYYWLRVVVRYRLAIGVIGYGLLKFFPLQAPYPSISNLNTAYGDYTDWKIFSLSLGIVPGYESFLGLVEIASGLLLLYRKTATIGAFVILFFTGNVFMSNLAYSGGEHIYSLYLLAFALFLLAYDAIRLYTLFGLEKPVRPNRFKPHFEGWRRTARFALKSLFLLFFVFLYGFKTYEGQQKDPYQYPTTKGLAGAAGLYNVSEFRINNQLLPYSKTDPKRWSDVVFEKWATLSIRSNRPVQLQHATTEQISYKDKDRIYELAGSAGRHYYEYKIDSSKGAIVLENKNSNYSNEHLVLNYQRPTKDRIILNGLDYKGDSIYVVLDRIPKKYLLKEASDGRGKPIKL